MRRTSIRPGENTLSPAVMVDFCPIDQCFETQIDDAANSKNRMYATAFQRWRDCFDGQINLYSYYRKYVWRSLPLVLPHYIAGDVRWYAANGASGVSIYGEPGDWAAYEVNHYVLARVAANPALDVDSLLCDFTRARYGRHATFAREVLDLFERLPRRGAAIPNTTLKSVAEYDGWLAEIDAAAAGLAGEYAETIPIPVPCGVCPCRWSTCTMNLPFAGCVRPEVLRRMPRP